MISPVESFWCKLRQGFLDAALSRRLAAEYNRNTCAKCGIAHSNERIAIAPCLNCEEWVCYRCHNPALPFGSVSDFNYFLVDTGRFKELNVSGVWLWPVMCPECRTNIPGPAVVNSDMLPDQFRSP